MSFIYKYIIFKKDSTIQELCYDSKNEEIITSYTFSFTNIKDQLYKDMITRNSNTQKINAYYRIKKWIIKNHGELMI